MKLTIKRADAAFVIRDEQGYSWGYFYFENDRDRAMVAKLPTEEEAKRAAQISARALTEASRDAE